MSDIRNLKRETILKQPNSLSQKAEDLPSSLDEGVVRDAISGPSVSFSGAPQTRQSPTRQGLTLPRQTHQLTSAREGAELGARKPQRDAALSVFLTTLQQEHMPVIVARKGEGPLTLENCFDLTTYVMKEFNGREVVECFDDISCFLWHPVYAKEPQEVKIPNLDQHQEYISLARALVDCNHMESLSLQRYAAQALLAAFLTTSSLEVQNGLLAADIIARMPTEFKPSALNDALVMCQKKTGVLAARKLVEWGANPDAERSLDDMPALVRAIRWVDRPMIEFLLSAGANPDLESLMYPTPREHLAFEKYAGLVDLFATKKE